MSEKLEEEIDEIITESKNSDGKIHRTIYTRIRRYDSSKRLVQKVWERNREKINSEVLCLSPEDSKELDKRIYLNKVSSQYLSELLEKGDYMFENGRIYRIILGEDDKRIFKKSGRII